MRGNIIKKSVMSFAFEKIARISLHWRLVPIHNREYENGLLLQSNLSLMDSIEITLQCPVSGGLVYIQRTVVFQERKKIL